MSVHSLYTACSCSLCIRKQVLLLGSHNALCGFSHNVVHLLYKFPGHISNQKWYVVGNTCDLNP